MIVAWRARDHVLQCLAALGAHSDVSYEAIVVDDASGDGTGAAVRAGFPDTRVIEKDRNEGLAAGRNTALAHVRGRCVLMLDADTEIRPGVLSTLVRTLDERPGVGLVGPKLLYPNGELQLSCRRFPPFAIPFLRRGILARLFPDPAVHQRHLMADWDHSSERAVAYVIGAAQMWRAGLPALIRQYDERISSYGGEDIDWCLRVWAAGLEVVYVPDATVVHHYQKQIRNQLWGRKSWRAFRDWYYIQWKHRRLRRDPRLSLACR